MASSYPISNQAGTNTTLKSISSSSKSSSDGPVVKSTKFYASTEPLLQRPVTTLPILPGPKLKQWATCRDKISQLLQSTGFNFRSVNLLNVRGSNSTETHTRFIIEVESIEEHERWEEIIISSCHELHHQNCLDLGVEIVTQDPSWDMRIFAVGADHPVVTIWPNLRDKVVDLLRPYDWRALDMLLYGKTVQDASPTIFVTLEGNSDDDWLGLQRQINGLGVNIQVETRQGKIEQVTHRINNKTPTESPPNRTYVQKIHGGWSIGVEEERSGTLGGFIKLCHPTTGTQTIHALTNYHVVRPNISTFPAAIDNGAITPTWPSTYSKVQSPSQQDHDAEIRHLQQMTRESNHECESSLKLRLKVELDEATPLETRHWEALVKPRDLFAARLKKVEAIDVSDLYLGNVSFYSGFRTAKNHALDWALVEVATDRIGENRLPNSDEVPNRFSLEGTQVSEIKRDFETERTRPLFKIGRTTALTVGRYSHTESVVNVPLPLNSKDGARGPKRFRESREHVLVIEGGKPGDLFSEGGDSGSWVFDMLGSLAGMVWGSSAAHATYYTPIGLVITDIEERTGMKVELI